MSKRCVLLHWFFISTFDIVTLEKISLGGVCIWILFYFCIVLEIRIYNYNCIRMYGTCMAYSRAIQPGRDHLTDLTFTDSKVSTAATPNFAMNSSWKKPNQPSWNIQKRKLNDVMHESEVKKECWGGTITTRYKLNN